MITLESCPFEEPTTDYKIEQQEQTNEDFIRTASTYNLAVWIVCVAMYGAMDEVFKNGHQAKDFHESCVKWLKEKRA